MGHLATLRQPQAQALERDLFCIKLVQSCTDLIDELQRERGLAQLLLGTMTESYLAALSEQIRFSTEAEQALREQLRELETAPGASTPEMLRQRQIGLGLMNSPGLADLAAMRSELRLLRCSREQMFEAYCDLIARLLVLVETTGQACSDPELGQQVSTLVHLMWCKEYSGQERGRGAGLFASGCHDARVWQQLARLIETQQRCASAFICQASPGARQRLKESLQLETQVELEALRQQLADHPDQAPLDTAMGEIWFRGCSRRMNELREVERGLLQETLQALEQRQAQQLSSREAAELAQTSRLAPGAVETVLRTAAAWLAGNGPAGSSRNGMPA
ncbi:MAG: hypothetical protein RLZZ555_617 [Pseudomonadota bacterium]